MEDLEQYVHRNPHPYAENWCVFDIKKANHAMLALFDVEDVNALWAHIDDVLFHESPDKQVQRIACLYRGKSFQLETESRTASGRKIHILISSSIPEGYEGTWGKVFTSILDITEKVHTEQKRQRMNSQLNEARQVQALSTLAGGIAHQFNNALGVILGRLDLLEAGHDDMPAPRWTASMKRSVDRMNRLTDQLLAYARGGKYQPRRFSANELVRQILLEESRQSGPSVAVTQQLDTDLLPTRGDITQIRMVIASVFANAVESLHQDGKIHITTANYRQEGQAADEDPHLPPGQYAVITIEDNGVGMDESTRSRIFEPFFTTKLFGRGLGMAAAYGIVQNHDGIITVHSAPCKGTRVCIYLPEAEEEVQLQVS